MPRQNHSRSNYIQAFVEASTHRAVRIHAAQSDTTISTLVQRYVREGLARDGVVLDEVTPMIEQADALLAPKSEV